MGLPPLILNVVLTSVSVVVIYAAAFRFRLDWPGVVGIMILTTFIIDLIVKYTASTKAKTQRQAAALFAGAMETLIFTVSSAIAIMVILAMRFGFATALGIFVISWITNSVLRFIV